MNCSYTNSFANMSQDWAVCWKANTHRPVADETLQVLHACIWYASICTFSLSWDIHALYQTKMNLPIYNMHMQANNYYQQELGCCSFGQRAGAPIHFFSTTHSSKCSKKQMCVIHVHCEVVSCQCCCIPVDPYYRHFRRCCTPFVVFLDRVARISWQKSL